MSILSASISRAEMTAMMRSQIHGQFNCLVLLIGRERANDLLSVLYEDATRQLPLSNTEYVLEKLKEAVMEAANGQNLTT